MRPDTTSQRLQTDVARLSKEVSAKTRAEQRFDEFEQIRERVFSRMYDLHKEEMKQAAKDCRAALDLFNIFGPARLETAAGLPQPQRAAASRDWRTMSSS